MILRPACPDDRAFVVSGWSSSLRLTRDLPLVQMTTYATHMHAILGEVLERPRVEVIVAEGSVLQGFMVFERPDHVLYCYVAQPFRRNGIARQLFAAAGIDPASRFDYACRTKASWVCRHKIPLAIYNPYRARFAPEEKHDEQRDPVRSQAVRT